MAFALLLSAPPLKLSIYGDKSSRKTLHANGFYLERRKRRGALTAVKSSGDGEVEEEETGSFNPFGFVTDNPSSRSAIQLPESPAEDGNVGQMLYVNILIIIIIFDFEF